MEAKVNFKAKNGGALFKMLGKNLNVFFIRLVVSAHPIMLSSQQLSSQSSSTMTTLRVRSILQNLNSVQTADLKKLLPSKLKMPTADTQRYPNAIMSAFPADQSYSLLGFLAEHLLRLPAAEIHLNSLCTEMKKLMSLSTEAEKKIRESKTTQPFLDALVTTRKELEKVLRSGQAEGPLKFEEVLKNGHVEGHPDIYNNTQVFEVKLTGMLKQNWTSFLLQLFAYGALLSSVTDLYLVLPLQQTVWHVDIRSWAKRADYLKFLSSWSAEEQTTGLQNQIMAMMLCAAHNIGCHIGKQKTIKQTILQLQDFSKPHQIFLSGPQSSHMNVSDTDLAEGLATVDQTGAKIYIHAQYIINLSTLSQKEVDEGKDDWGTKLLIKNLQYGKAMGAKGVVVHVGKSVKLSVPDAIENMRSALNRAKEYASVDCPILLETPAGQGTELLTGSKEFLDFVESFSDHRIRMCLDTCHVFASGHKPLPYINVALARPGLLKLIHYNDSLGDCGSCVDRHAFIGRGKIGFETMEKIAALCSKNNLPMIIE
jgi:deoxyribonuclease-4